MYEDIVTATFSSFCFNRKFKAIPEKTPDRPSFDAYAFEFSMPTGKKKC